MYATKGYKLHMHYIIIKLHSQILIIVVIVAFTRMISVDYIMNSLEHSKFRLPFF